MITLADGTEMRALHAIPHLRTPHEIRGASPQGYPTHDVVAVCGRQIPVTAGTQAFGLTRCPDCIAIVKVAQ
jgi:hypothetical protein